MRFERLKKLLDIPLSQFNMIVFLSENSKVRVIEKPFIP